MKVPQRKYGTIRQDPQTTVQNPNLATRVPLIGLGCSSFSAFFSSSDDCDEKNNSESGKTTLTAENISTDHPDVVGWIETIRHAVLDRGINLLDTAPWYGHGISEIVIGYALDTILANDETENDKMKIPYNEVTSNSTTTTPLKQTWDLPSRTRHGTLPRTKLIINTKIGRYESDPLKQFDFTYETTMQSVQRSLQRMNCGYIDVLQLHDPEFLIGMPMTPSSSEKNGMEMLLTETIPALLECKSKGWTKGLGITGYPLEVQHEILVRCGEAFGGNDGMAVVFDQSLVYCHCNLHDMSLFRDRSFAISERSSRDSSNGDCGNDTDTQPTTITTPTHQSFAKFCEQANINLMCAAPLSMGLLTNSGPPSWHPATPSLKEVCVEAAKLCQRSGIVHNDDGNTNNNININISSLALLFALSQRKVGCTLIGMKNVEEVDVAAELAVRFRDVDFDCDDGSDGWDEEGVRGQEERRRRWWWNSILSRVLSSEEEEMLELLMDEVNGPFAKVWSNGEYRWDGMAEVKKFWSLVQERKSGNDADESS